MEQTYYLFSNGELHRKDDNLLLIKEDGSKVDIPIERIDDLYIFGEMKYNSKLFSFLSTYGVSVHMFNYYDFYIGSFCSRNKNVSGELLVKQVEYYSDNAKRVSIAKEFILAANDSIYRNLRYYNERGKDLEEYMSYIKAIKKDIENVKNVSELMGYEGNMRKKYYEAFNIIINQEIDFVKRVKRPPDNMINTLISYCNSLLYTKVLSEIYKTQMNPTISFLHEPGTKRFSLSLDIAEVFKPLIVDRLIFSLLNKNIITESDFDDEVGYLRIKDKGVRKIVDKFDEKMKTTLKHRELNREVSYQYLIRLEVYKLIKHIMGEKEYSSFRIWW